MPVVLRNGGAAKGQTLLLQHPLWLLPPRVTKAGGKDRDMPDRTGRLTPKPPALDGGGTQDPVCLNAVSSLSAAFADLPHYPSDQPLGSGMSSAG